MNDRFLSSRFFKPSGISKAGARTPPSSNDQQEVKQEVEQHELAPQDEENTPKVQRDNITYAIFGLKNAIRQMEDCSKRFYNHKEALDITLQKYESTIERFEGVLEMVEKIEVESTISQASIDFIRKLLTNFGMTVQHERGELEKQQENAINNFVVQLKAGQDVFLNKQDEQFAAYNRKLKRTLDSYGFWCSTKVFYWLLGIFLFLFLFMVLVIVLFWAGNLSFRTY